MIQYIPHEISIGFNYTTPTALLKVDDDGKPCSIFLVIDWTTPYVTVNTRPFSAEVINHNKWRGYEDEYTLPLDTDASLLRDWVRKEVVPRVTPLGKAFRLVLRDGTYYGTFPGHEEEKKEFDRWMYTATPPLLSSTFWMVEDWLEPVKNNVIEYLTSYDFTPEIVEELAEEIVEDAQLDDVVLIGGEDAVMKYLRKIVEK